MKFTTIRPLVLAVTLASASSLGLAQTSSTPTDNQADPAAATQAPPPADTQPTDAMSPATPPTPADPTMPPSPTTPPEVTADPAMTPAAPDPVMAPDTTPVVDNTVVEDREERHGGFPWGLLGLLGLLGLIPRKAKVVETYTTRDTTVRTGPGYDDTRRP